MSAVTVNGTAVANGHASQNIPLAIGTNEILTEVTAENGEQRTYRTIVYRKATNDGNADLIFALIKTVTDSFGDSPSDAMVIAAKSNIEDAVEGYNSLTDSQKVKVTDEQKTELFALYDQLMKAITYITEQSTANYYVEATEGFITNLATKLNADDGEKLTIRLNVDKVSAPISTALGKAVADTFDLTVSEIRLV